MKKITSLIMLLILLGGLVYSQQPEITKDSDQLVFQADSNQTPEVKMPALRKLRTGLELGTAFTYAPKNFYGPSFYIAPNISYRLSSKVTVQAGLIYEKSTFYPLYQLENYSQDILPMTRTFLYTRGSYSISNNLTVSGAVYKSIDNIPKLSKYQNAYQYNIQGLQLDLQYKINNSISLGFRVIQQNGMFSDQPTY